MDAVRVEAWRVHDTGLVAVPTRFRRLRGQVRHLQGRGEPWPDQVALAVEDGVLHVTSARDDLGRWPLAEVSAVRQGDGPPVHFVLEVPTGAHLLAAAAGPATDALLDALAS